MKFLFLLVVPFALFVFANNIYALDCAGADKGKIECKFGTITPPSPIAGFIGDDETGATGISKFLSNAIVLIYSLAAVALVFMLLWGAFDWITSGGDKEKLSVAQKRILNAIIGIILFAVAFAIMAVLGRFTGFTFFTSSNPAVPNLPCPPGRTCTIL